MLWNLRSLQISSICRIFQTDRKDKRSEKKRERETQRETERDRERLTSNKFQVNLNPFNTKERSVGKKMKSIQDKKEEN